MTNKWFNCIHDGNSKTIFVFGEIGGYNSQTAENLALELGDASEVELLIDSPGGDSKCALEVFDALAGKKVEAIITGRCYSSAVILALRAGVIRCYPDTHIMVHSPIAYAVGSGPALRCEAEKLDRTFNRLACIIANRTGQSVTTVKGWMLPGKDTWFNAQEALAAGLVDAIVERPAQRVRPSTGPDGAMPPKPRTAEEILLRDLLAAVGTVPTNDRQALLRDVHAWLAQSVKEPLP
jgi:ATP-dependent Clp protease protease subunit